MLFEDAKTLDPAEESASGSDIQAEIEKIGTLLAEYKASVDPADEAQTGKIAELESELATLSGMLENYSAEAASEGAAESTGNSAGNSIATFVAAFGIILREGLEAILVIGAIIAYLVKSGNKDKVRIVYIGSVVGIALSFVAAWLLNALKLANQAPQEVIEGVTALIAVVVLFYVSNWMVSKSESAAWTRYIDSKVSASVETGSMFTLGFTAFLAVFREGAEVVLFYQPMLAEGNPSMVWYGFAVGCVVLVAVFLLIRFLSIKIPIKPFFLGTSILMCLMSISFLGSGIKELIEGDVIKTVTPFLTNIIPYNDVMDVLGLYPILQTLLPQFILLVISVVTFIIHIRRNRKIAAEAKARG
ncbi:MAG: FTR1 family iron permease [Clostridia bacterium]|nr:FTR1 family iron permease [Clostridia bacterium]